MWRHPDAGVCEVIQPTLKSGYNRHFDLSAYDAYLSGKLEDYEYPTEEVRRSIASLPVTV